MIAKLLFIFLALNNITLKVNGSGKNLVEKIITVHLNLRKEALN